MAHPKKEKPKYPRGGGTKRSLETYNNDQSGKKGEPIG